VQNSNNTWTQTQPDGFQVMYNTSGTPIYLASPNGGRWTLGYASGLVLNVTDPFNNRTTYAYTGGGSIRRIQDAAGRITSFTVNGSSNLTRMITPDSAVTSLIYDGSHRLIGYSDPNGNRTSYSYDGNSFVNSITTPSGNRTTYLYLNWGATRVTDAAGQMTTLLYNFNRNVAGTIDPLGNRSTYLWVGSRLQGFIDGNGHRSTLTYAQLTTRTPALQSIHDAVGGRFTFLYNASNQVQALIDQLGNRSTLTWDGNGNRTAVKDALGKTKGTHLFSLTTRPSFANLPRCHAAHARHRPAMFTTRSTAPLLGSSFFGKRPTMPPSSGCSTRLWTDTPSA
jgi:YD repeat-containing protein